MPAVLCSLALQSLYAQTDVDAIMLKRNVLCIGGMYTNDSWTNYWAKWLRSGICSEQGYDGRCGV